MNVGNIKGAILEFIVRNILKSCGFTNVLEEKPFVFKDGDLLKINGKGAAHDADVLMDPPIQIPFSYPMRIIFECKAYSSKVGLPIIRNALGLREDINNFEIVTKDFLIKRKNNNRTAYAIENRNRHLYQVGIVTLGDFTTPALEFAVNCKIPLLSIEQNFNTTIANKINEIAQETINSYTNSDVENFYKFLKDRNGDLDSSDYLGAKNILNAEGILSQIISSAEELTNRTYIGLLNNGQIIFLYSQNQENIIFNSTSNLNFNAQIHWRRENKNIWTLEVSQEGGFYPQETFIFYLPDQIMKEWGKTNYNKAQALNLKRNYFSKIMVFNKGIDNSFPMSIIKLDEDWFNQLNSELEEGSNEID